MNVVASGAVEGPDAFAALTVVAAAVVLAFRRRAGAEVFVVAMAVVSTVVGGVARVASCCRPPLAAPHQAAWGLQAAHSASDLLQRLLGRASASMLHVVQSSSEPTRQQTPPSLLEVALS